jgi:hypothetical protein
VTWTNVYLTAAKFKPLILSMSGFVLPTIANFSCKNSAQTLRKTLFLLLMTSPLKRKFVYRAVAHKRVAQPRCSTAARRGRHRKHSLIYCWVSDSVYSAVAWQRVDQICFNINLYNKVFYISVHIIVFSFSTLFWLLLSCLLIRCHCSIIHVLSQHWNLHSSLVSQAWLFHYCITRRQTCC